MSIEANKAAIRRYYEEAWNNQNLDVLPELLSPDYQNHNPFIPGMPTGPEGVPIVINALASVFPDLRYVIEDQIGEGELVVTRWSFHGTQQGEFMGLPATGKPVSFSGISIERFVDNRIVEHWRVTDELSLLQQLGVIPMSIGQG